MHLPEDNRTSGDLSAVRGAFLLRQDGRVRQGGRVRRGRRMRQGGRCPKGSVRGGALTPGLACAAGFLPQGCSAASGGTIQPYRRAGVLRQWPYALRMVRAGTRGGVPAPGDFPAATAQGALPHDMGRLITAVVSAGVLLRPQGRGLPFVSSRSPWTPAPAEKRGVGSERRQGKNVSRAAQEGLDGEAAGAQEGRGEDRD